VFVFAKTALAITAIPADP